MRYPNLAAGDTVHVRALVISTDHSHARVQLGEPSYRQLVYVPRETISAVDKSPDAQLTAQRAA
jgi:hypothetical protein